MSARLKINEIFYSIQGESTRTGLPTIFVRLSGCPLRCTYCDTAYAFYSGERRYIEEIIETISQFPCQTICVTGGEPLAQEAVHLLMQRLCDLAYQVSIETSGALDIGMVDPRVMIVMDLKTPSSGEVDRNDWTNLKKLKPQDQIKTVILNETDFKWYCDVMQKHTVPKGVEWLVSPVTPGLVPSVLAQWVLEQALPVRLQVQLHKTLWGDTQGR